MSSTKSQAHTHAMGLMLLHESIDPIFFSMSLLFYLLRLIFSADVVVEQLGTQVRQRDDTGTDGERQLECVGRDSAYGRHE